MKFDLKTNHIVNLLLILAGASLVVYNHHVSGSTEPLGLDDFMPLAPAIGQYLAAIKAHGAESTKWITAPQLLTILEMCKERGIDPQAFARENWNTRVQVLTRTQATAAIVKLKKRLKIEEGSDA